jgi:hypothetical protein
LHEVEAQEEAERVETARRSEKATAQASSGRRPRGRKPSDPKAALAHAEADLAALEVQAEARPERADLAQAVEHSKGVLIEAKKAADAAPAKKIEVNVTDPDSRIMKTIQGWLQGYNIQAAVNDSQVVIAYSATQDANDSNQLIPMIEATEKTAEAAGITEEIGLVLADAGYWSEDNATSSGPDRLIATIKDWKQRKAARELGTTIGPPPMDATALEAMEHRLRTPEGTEAYATRSHTVEPVFGNAKENRGYRRFMRRSLSAADSEAGLIFATHNLLKIFHHNPSVVFGTA